MVIGPIFLSNTIHTELYIAKVSHYLIWVMRRKKRAVAARQSNRPYGQRNIIGHKIISPRSWPPPSPIWSHVTIIGDKFKREPSWKQQEQTEGNLKENSCAGSAISRQKILIICWPMSTTFESFFSLISNQSTR